MDVSIHNNMQAVYPNKQPARCWDEVHLQYPVRKFPETERSSTTIGHDFYGAPEILKKFKDPLTRMKEYYRDYTIEKNLMQSQTKLDFGFKHPDTKRQNKHTSCNENLYIYPPSRRLADRPPQLRAHGTTEKRSAYKEPTVPARLVTQKEQYMHPANLSSNPPDLEPSWHKDLNPLDTTHDGFEKYLDPYLTTSRLHHRPYTADQLSRECNAPARNIVTYYTLSDTTMVRTPKTKSEFWRLQHPRPKSTYDREKFKEEYREIRTHNRPTWVPGSFRTEIRDNFTSFKAKPGYKIPKLEEDVQSMYLKRLANLPPNKDVEYAATLKGYTTENSTVGSKKPVCTVLDQFKEKNKRIEMKDKKSARAQ